MRPVRLYRFNRFSREFLRTAPDRDLQQHRSNSRITGTGNNVGIITRR